MVGDNAWNNYIRGSAAIMQDAIAEDVLAEVPSELYSQEDNALAEVEEAWLAVGEEARDPAAPDWPGQEVAVANDGSLAAVEQLLDHMSNLATKAQPQQDYRNGSTAMGQAGGGPCALKQSLEAHGITSVTRLRGGGGTGDRRQEDKYQRVTGSEGKRRMVWEPEAERKRQRRSPHERGTTTFNQHRRVQRSGAESQRRWLRRRRELESRASKETRGREETTSGRLGGTSVAVGRPAGRRQLSVASKEATVGMASRRRQHHMGQRRWQSATLHQPGGTPLDAVLPPLPVEVRRGVLWPERLRGEGVVRLRRSPTRSTGRATPRVDRSGDRKRAGRKQLAGHAEGR